MLLNMQYSMTLFIQYKVKITLTCIVFPTKVIKSFLIIYFFTIFKRRFMVSRLCYPSYTHVHALNLDHTSHQRYYASHTQTCNAH